MYSHKNLTGPYIKADIPDPVCRWIRFCETIDNKRKRSEQVRMDILRRIYIRIELRRRFIDWRNMYRCQFILRKYLAKRYFKYIRFITSLRMNKPKLEKLLLCKYHLVASYVFKKWLKFSFFQKADSFYYNKSLRYGLQKFKCIYNFNIATRMKKYFHRWNAYIIYNKKLLRLLVF